MDRNDRWGLGVCREFAFQPSSVIISEHIAAGVQQDETQRACVDCSISGQFRDRSWFPGIASNGVFKAAKRSLNSFHSSDVPLCVRSPVSRTRFGDLVIAFISSMANENC